ncbi:adenylate/guanylate cyclase domain-containing protein [Sphingobium yanoikuyae]|uniref:adenylate/guanylate cyclase domain-containing protein n=1 Tax=Sphingobium yanoikuyae TaxID=13690 RepID=UPI002431F830|nr:adenylate/guanylate cyclase domain-containing protein [Sphingobium yanoikuyae]
MNRDFNNMTKKVWKSETTDKRVATRLKEVETVEIKDYVRDTDLHGLARNKAYRVDGVHVYADILNLGEMLQSTEVEGETCHKRTLRFLNLHYRAVYRIIAAVDAIQVDFHNQRLHLVVAKPYGDEAARVHKAVAIGQLIMDVLAKTGEDGDDKIPSAKVRVGIDTGLALAVRNGRRGSSEPLFLGVPANHAAKRAGGGTKTGIYLSNEARGAIDLDAVDDEDVSALTAAEVGDSQEEAALAVTADGIVRDWKKDLEANPIGKFSFSGHTPPFADLDLEVLTPGNSRRNDAISIYADIDGFTAYVADNIDDDDDAMDVVRALHVLRAELDAVLTEDFGGRKIRFIGDCVHGVIGEGTAQTADTEASASTAILCAGGLRSGFVRALELLEDEGIDVAGLGIAIGLDAGPVALTRLGMKGSMIRCATGRAILASEHEQRRCAGDETAVGAVAYGWCSNAGQKIFGSSRKRSGLTYDVALEELADEGDTTAAAAKVAKAAMAMTLLEPIIAAPAAAAPSAFRFPNRDATPTKPAGFA